MNSSPPTLPFSGLVSCTDAGAAAFSSGRTGRSKEAQGRSPERVPLEEGGASPGGRHERFVLTSWAIFLRPSLLRTHLHLTRLDDKSEPSTHGGVWISGFWDPSSLSSGSCFQVASSAMRNAENAWQLEGINVSVPPGWEGRCCPVMQLTRVGRYAGGNVDAEDHQGHSRTRSTRCSSLLVQAQVSTT